MSRRLNSINKYLKACKRQTRWRAFRVGSALRRVARLWIGVVLGLCSDTRKEVRYSKIGAPIYITRR